MRQVQISAEVYDGDRADSTEEVEFVLDGEAGTDDLHRVFMSIAHFLGYDIGSMESIACDTCDICQECEIKKETAELEKLRNEMDNLEAVNKELREKLNNCCPVPIKKDWYIPPYDHD